MKIEFISNQEFPKYVYPELFINKDNLFVQCIEPSPVSSIKNEFLARQVLSLDKNDFLAKKSEFVPFKGSIIIS